MIKTGVFTLHEKYVKTVNPAGQTVPRVKDGAVSIVLWVMKAGQN